jgi:hypothetical protein
LTGHAVLIALTLEDALMTGIDRVADYMVRMPVCACMWHPLSFVRQTMLASSFSFLPINAGSEHAPDWRLISDCAVAAFLRSPDAPNRSARLGVTIRQAVEEHGLVLKQPHLCTIDDVVQAALANCQGLPVLIVSKDHKMLLGIATPFDLL